MGQTRGGQGLTVAATGDVIQFAVGSFEITPVGVGDINFIVKAEYFNRPGISNVTDGSGLIDGDIITPLGSSMVFHTAAAISSGPAAIKSYGGDVITLAELEGLTIQKAPNCTVLITEYEDGGVVFSKKVNLSGLRHPLQFAVVADTDSVNTATIEVLGGVLLHNAVGAIV